MRMEREDACMVDALLDELDVSQVPASEQDTVVMHAEDLLPDGRGTAPAVAPNPEVRRIVEFLQSGKWGLGVEGIQWAYAPGMNGDGGMAEGKGAEGLSVKLSVEHGEQLRLDIKGIRQRSSFITYSLLQSRSVQQTEVEVLRAIQEYLHGW